MNSTMVLTPEECRKVLGNYSKGAIFKNFKVSPFSEQVLGFLGEHYNLEITFDLNQNDESVEFFMKMLPVCINKHMEFIQQTCVFKKELLLYENLLPHLQTFFNKKFIPRKYLTDSETFIVLENLKKRGYAAINKELSTRQWFATLETLARFHASSIIFEENHSSERKPYRLCDNFQEEMSETYLVFEEGHLRKTTYANTFKAILDIIEHTEFKDNKMAKENFENFWGREIQQLVKPSEKFRNTLCHCDMWRNNFMFREKNGKLECILIDFQIARYVPPAWDVLLALYLNCGPAFLDENMTSLLTYYYNCFCDNLELYNIEPDKVLDSVSFAMSVEAYKPAALLQAMLSATMMFISRDLSKRIISDDNVYEEYIFLNRSKYLLREFESNEYFRERFSDLLHLFMKCFPDVTV